MDARDILTPSFVTELFSDCIGQGAVLDSKGDTFTLTFSDPNKFYFGFSILNDGDIRCFSDLPSLSDTMKADKFIENLDVLSTVLLQFQDGVDRGVSV